MSVRARGAVLVETALFVSAALVFMLGTLQIGVLGFLQLTSDSAAYFDARANVLTVSSGTPESQTHMLFPQIPASSISTQALPAPTPTIPVDYGYNDPDPTVRANSAVQRHGGASMMQPSQEQSTVALTGIARILGQSLGATGVAVEPMWLECGVHFNIGNGQCSTAPNSASEQNYFTQGENTPPYMVGFNYMQQCSMVGPWGIYTGPLTSKVYSPALYPYYYLHSFNNDASYGWNGPCASGQNNGNSYIGFIAMGSAEFLDSANWSDQTAGVSGACDTSGGTAQSVFEAAAFHQRTFAVVAAYLSEVPDQYLLEQYSQQWDSKVNTQNQWNSNAPNAKYAGGMAGLTATPEAINTFKTWEGFDDSSYGPSSSANDVWNNAVHTIYGWDVSVGQGNPSNDPNYANPTFPEKGCT